VEDLDSLREGAAKADGVIHLAFNHDFSQFQKGCEDDRKAIEAMGEVLVGSNRPFVVTSPAAVAMSADGKPVTENSPFAPWNPRAASEIATKALTARGVITAVVRLSQVHDTHKQGIVTYAVQVAREEGKSAYIGHGSNRWSAAHVSDVARLYVWRLRRRSPARSITRSMKRACR
jgi:nucleoside-diphosphate-sugar epimerase